MEGRIFLLAILMLVVSSFFVYAQETVPVSLILEGENASFSQIVVDYEIKSFATGELFYGSIQSSEEGELSFNLEPAFYEFAVSVDYPDTYGFDYFGKISSKVEQSSEITVTLFSVGSLEVMTAERSGKPMSNVLVKIDCQNNRGQQGYFRTDEFGLVEVKQVPTGSCVVRAAFEDFIITKNIEVEQGSKERIDLVFDEYSSSNFPFVTLLILFVVFVVIVLGFFFYSKKPVVATESKNKTSKEDIITALNETEKKVVRFMLEEQKKFIVDGGRIRDFYVNQAKIIYGAKVPKTTLVRILQSLENKQILNVEKEGKIKKIAFTDWFRSK